MTRAVLVTGGAGYVGSHACKALAAAGFWPVTYDNLTTGNRWAVRWGPLELGDITRSRPTQGGAAPRTSAVAVLHFAAVALVGEADARSSRYATTQPTSRHAPLLDSHAATPWITPARRLSSSCAVYGVGRALAYRRERASSVQSVLMRTSKLMAERRAGRLRDVPTG